jgi:hypothetical protein
MKHVKILLLWLMTFSVCALAIGLSTALAMTLFMPASVVTTSALDVSNSDSGTNRCPKT